MGISTGRRLALAALLLVAALALGACGVTPRSNGIAAAVTATSTTDPQSRIHNVSADSIPLFVRITFTNSTSYDQAVAILESGPRGESPDPWGCDDPRSPTPPPYDVRQSAYDGSHALLIEYPAWDELRWLASSPLVIAVDGGAVFMCP
jgi:hypothetical protein